MYICAICHRDHDHGHLQCLLKSTLKSIQYVCNFCQVLLCFIQSWLKKNWTIFDAELPRHIYDICPFFSTDTGTIFGSIFLHTKVRKSRQKISTKQPKLPKTWFYNSLMAQNTLNCTHHFSTLQIFFTFLKRRAFSTWKFIMWRISPHDNLLCEEISPHDKQILHRHRL